MSIDSTELNQAFQTFIDEINDDSGDFVYNKLQLDSHLLYINNGENSHFVLAGDNFKIFESHEAAKTEASFLARQNPEQRISILRVIENVGFMPF